MKSIPNGGPEWTPEEEAENEAVRKEGEALARLQGLTIQQVIQAGHEAILRNLVAKSEAGTASHQELAILRNLLRDNGMTLGVPPAQPQYAPGAQPRELDLPELSAPDYDA